MTFLGKYFIDKSTDKAEHSKKAGNRKARFTQLLTKYNTNLKAEELYLNANAIDAVVKKL